MGNSNYFSLVSALLALQFVVIGWRISREIEMGDKGRRTWLLLPDLVNMPLMLAVVICCIVLPIKTGGFAMISRAVLAAGYMFICFTPFAIAGHYRLFSKASRGSASLWATEQEIFFVVLGLMATAGAVYFIVH
jgi:hypothetical protein